MPALIAERDSRRLLELRARVRAVAEDRPGVYRMITETGEVAYVGKSKRLRTRLLSYFRADYPRDKAARIVHEAHDIAWTYVPSEFAALLEELRLIKSLRPRLNVAQKRDARNYCFVRIGTGRAPRLTVVRGSGAAERGGVFYGPFVGATHLRDAVRELSIALGLRDCSLDSKMRFADQLDLLDVPLRTPGCLRFEIGTCLGPCVGAPSASAYGQQVREARAFFEGQDGAGPIAEVERAMFEASARLEYERAAVLRNRVQRLEGLQERFSRLRFAVESLSFVYVVPGYDGDNRYYLIRRGVVRHQAAAPATAADWQELGARARDVFDPGLAAGAVPAHDVDELLLLTSWFSTRPEELDATFLPDALADGDPAQPGV